MTLTDKEQIDRARRHLPYGGAKLSNEEILRLDAFLTQREETSCRNR